MFSRLIITCEHGGNRIPARYRSLFAGATKLMTTHRAYDPGALDLFKIFLPLADYSISSEDTRLLVELNRSLHHPKLFSQVTNALPAKEKKDILDHFYYPYRDAVEEKIARFTGDGETVLHISVHSFTPVMNGKVRMADIGFLYDPSRATEKQFSALWKEALLEKDPGLLMRMNYPYKGISDGFTTYLRKKFKRGYSGIELEVNQAVIGQKHLREDLYSGLHELVSKYRRKA